MTPSSPGSSNRQPPKSAPEVPKAAKSAKDPGPTASACEAIKAYEANKPDAPEPSSVYPESPVPALAQEAGTPARQLPPVQLGPSRLQVVPGPAGLQVNVTPNEIQISPGASPETEKPANDGKPGPAFDKTDTGIQVKTAPGGITITVAPDAIQIEPGDAPAEAAVEEAQVPVVAPEPPKPKWKELEPQDANDPVPHMEGVCCPLDKQWDLVAGSVRGKLHAHKAMYRDDAFAFDCVDGWHILAVSDGAGSAKLSRVGARVTCDAAVGAMKTMIGGYAISTKEGPQPPDRDLMQLRAFLTQAACAARDGIIREAHKRQVSDRDLYCTLLLCIHTTWKDDLDLLAAIQVGDGSIGIYTGDGTCKLLGIADHGEFSSETVFVTSFKQLIEMPYDRRVLFSLKRDVRCIGIMSDGVSDDFFPEDKRLIELFVGDPIAGIRDACGQPVKGVMVGVLRDDDPKAALLSWLKYEKKGSSDDRTLMLMYRKDKP